MAPTYDDISVYWRRRSETVRACAERYARWLRDLERIEPFFATWYRQGWSRRDAVKEKVTPTADYIEPILAASPIFSRSKPGWYKAFWTPGSVKGGDAKVEVSCGDDDLHALNTAHIELPHAGPAAKRIATREVMLPLFEYSIRAWEPHDGYVKSFQYWKNLPPRGPGVIWGGWMIYFSREAGRIPPLPAPAEIIPVDNLGHIIVYTPEPFREEDPEHIAWANHLSELLSKAGLKMATRD
jgi:hypothetical protein